MSQDTLDDVITVRKRYGKKRSTPPDGGEKSCTGEYVWVPGYCRNKRRTFKELKPLPAQWKNAPQTTRRRRRRKQKNKEKENDIFSLGLSRYEPDDNLDDVDLSL
jgi:hypothetical protein